MTQKLYEINAYTKEFTADVLECIKYDGFYKIVLSKTAFFPEGGGQASDTGFLGDVRVFDAQIENDIIYHYTDTPLITGSVVNGKLDFDRRFNFMQNHTGEHIVSGIAHKLFGVNNVGFHLGEELVTVDFDKELNREQLSEIEYLANCKVWQNLPIKVFFPSSEELNNIDYRSKKEIDGKMRLVEIKDTDICACCAPHLNFTSEVGLIKLLDCEKMRGGIRVVLKCGDFALKDYCNKYENISQISAQLSAKQENTADAVKILEQKLTNEKHKVSELKKKIATLTADNATEKETILFVEDCDVKVLQSLSDSLHKKFGGIRAVFTGSDENYMFAICGAEEPLQNLFAEFKSQFNVRGGGRGCMVQGSVTAPKDKIKMFFNF